MNNRLLYDYNIHTPPMSNKCDILREVLYSIYGDVGFNVISRTVYKMSLFIGNITVGLEKRIRSKRSNWKKEYHSYIHV